MILLDANLPLYAYDADSPLHTSARTWFEEALAGEETVGIPLATLLAFIRITTNPSVYRSPLPVREAIAIVREWLNETSTRVAHPTELHWDLLSDVAERGQARGPMLSDAHIAALAIEHGATLYTTDRDFARFPRLRFRNPLEPPSL